jgi:hypothetical protein
VSTPRHRTPGVHIRRLFPRETGGGASLSARGDVPPSAVTYRCARRGRTGPTLLPAAPRGPSPLFAEAGALGTRPGIYPRAGHLRPPTPTVTSAIVADSRQSRPAVSVHHGPAEPRSAAATMEAGHRSCRPACRTLCVVMTGDHHAHVCPPRLDDELVNPQPTTPSRSRQHICHRWVRRRASRTNVGDRGGALCRSGEYAM